MKSLLIALFTTTTFLICQGQSRLDDKQKEKLIRHVSSTIGRYCLKDYDGMLNGYTTDAAILDPALGKVLPIKEWAEARKKIDANYSAYSLTTEYAIVSEMNNDAWVMVYGQWDLESKRSGKKASFPIHFAHRMKDGKIAETRAYFDRVAIMVPMGYTITSPAEDGK